MEFVLTGTKLDLSTLPHRREICAKEIVRRELGLVGIFWNILAVKACG